MDATFSCAWSHPDCSAGPGPEHYRHVPLAQALADPTAPDHYVEQLPLLDVDAAVALADRSSVTETMAASFAAAVGRFGEDRRTSDGDWRRLTVARDRLARRAAATVLAALVDSTPASQITSGFVKAVCDAPGSGDGLRIRLACKLARSSGAIATRLLLLAEGGSPTVEALCRLLHERRRLDVEAAVGLARRLAALPAASREHAWQLLETWEPADGGFVDVIEQLAAG